MSLLLVRRLSSASFYRSATHVSECTVDTRMYAFSLHSYCVCVCGRVVAVRGLCGLAVFALWSYSGGASSLLSLSLGGASWSSPRGASSFSVWGFVVFRAGPRRLRAGPRRLRAGPRRLRAGPRRLRAGPRGRL